jgi:hypothetical protein
MRAWLHTQPYSRGYLGRLRVYLPRRSELRADQTGVRVTHVPTVWALGPDGRHIPGNCRQ